jgi:hypothetical protein
MADLQAGVGAIAVAIEQVFDDPKLLVERDAVLDKLISASGKAEKVSAHTYRLTFEDALPGNMSAIYLDNPAVNFPTPGSSDWQQGTLAPVSWSVPIGWTKLAEIAGKPNQTVVDLVSTQMARTIDRVRQGRDMMLCAGDGTGFLGNITAYDNVNFILTFNNNDFGARLIVKNQLFDIYNGTTLLGSVTAQSVSSSLGGTQTVNIGAAAPAGTAAGSIARVNGLTSGSPSFIYGIPYWMSNATTGITVGLDRSVATNNFIISNGVNAASSQVTQPLLRIPFDQIKQSLGVGVVKNGSLKIHVHPAQVASYEQLAGPQQMITSTSGSYENWDLLFSGKGSVNGVSLIENIHAHMQRWDYLNTDMWGKIMWGNSPFWFTSDGKKVFQQVGTNGQITSGAASFMIDTTQYYVSNPKAMSSIYAAKQPTGY